jgi:hypothetical protein
MTFPDRQPVSAEAAKSSSSAVPSLWPDEETRMLRPRRCAGSRMLDLMDPARAAAARWRSRQARSKQRLLQRNRRRSSPVTDIATKDSASPPESSRQPVRRSPPKLLTERRGLGAGSGVMTV